MSAIESTVLDDAIAQELSERLAFARARARGEAMSPRETVDYALAEFDRLLTELGAGDA
jgi:hypothetical protein